MTKHQQNTDNQSDAVLTTQERNATISESMPTTAENVATPSVPEEENTVNQPRESTAEPNEEDDNENTELTWSVPTTWIFLQIMLGCVEAFRRAADTKNKDLDAELYNHFLDFFREELTIQEAATPHFINNIDTTTMHQYWTSLRDRYEDIQYEGAPLGDFVFFEEVKEILNFDNSPSVVMESMSMGRGGGMSYRETPAPDPERPAAARAERNNVKRLGFQLVKEKVVDPARLACRSKINANIASLQEGSFQDPGEIVRAYFEEMDERDKLYFMDEEEMDERKRSLSRQESERIRMDWMDDFDIASIARNKQFKQRLATRRRQRLEEEEALGEQLNEDDATIEARIARAGREFDRQTNAAMFGPSRKRKQPSY